MSQWGRDPSRWGYSPDPVPLPVTARGWPQSGRGTTATVGDRFWGPLAAWGAEQHLEPRATPAPAPQPTPPISPEPLSAPQGAEPPARWVLSGAALVCPGSCLCRQRGVGRWAQTAQASAQAARWGRPAGGWTGGRPSLISCGGAPPSRPPRPPRPRPHTGSLGEDTEPLAPALEAPAEPRPSPAVTTPATRTQPPRAGVSSGALRALGESRDPCGPSKGPAVLGSHQQRAPGQAASHQTRLLGTQDTCARSLAAHVRLWTWAPWLGWPAHAPARSPRPAGWGPRCLPGAQLGGQGSLCPGCARAPTCHVRAQSPPQPPQRGWPRG